MRTTSTVLVALSVLAACERDPRSSSPPPEPPARIVAPAPVAPEPVRREAREEAPVVPAPVTPPPVAPPRPPRRAPRPAISANVVAPEVGDRSVRRGPDGLPLPPSVEPAVYAAWLRDRPATEKKRIAAFCSRHRQDFQEACGGIGPLHIPYPPLIRARRNTRESLFASLEEWTASLSPAQQRYLERECPGGEDQGSSDLCGDNTPLVVSFDERPIEFVAGTRFAFQAGAPTTTDWPTAETPWIAFDRDGDGVIDRGAELFGSDTVLPGGRSAPNGFVALAAFDDNHDGVIDAADPQFAHLVLWADRDADGRSTAGELAPVSATIVSISLASTVEKRCDERENCEGERSTLTWRDARGALHTGRVVDVYLPRR